MSQATLTLVDDLKSWAQCSFGVWRWTVHPEWATTLLDASGLRLEEWRSQSWLKVIKSAGHRSVWHAALPQGPIYIKHNPLNDLRARVRQQFRPSKARTEATTALALAARGVPTFTPIAIGETVQGESYLVTLALDGTRTLKDCVEHDVPRLASSERSAFRCQLADGLAALLARMHDTGVQHADLHAGNILIAVGCESLRQAGPVPSRTLRARMQLFLIDLHAVRLGPPLDWPARRDNLVMLNRWFVQRSSRTDRLRFWYAYNEQRKQSGQSARSLQQPKALANELERLTWDSCLSFWRRRDARCLGTNRYFHQLDHAGARAWAVRDLPIEIVKALLADPDQPFAQPIKTLKHSRSSTVAEIELVLDGQPRRLIWKRFAVTKWSDPWVHVARATPALRSWINGHRLIESGLPTARPLAVVHRQSLGLPRECYLLTEKLGDVCDVHARLVGLDWHKRRRLIERVARLVRELHRRQLSHRDLKAANLLIDAQGQLFLIDLVGLERWRTLPRSRQVQNLARLHASFHDDLRVSRTDKLRLLRSYLAWGLCGKAGWKGWWRAIGEATQRKIARNRQRGRPLS